MLRAIHWILGQFGFDPLATWRSLMQVPRFVGEIMDFKKAYVGVLAVKPCLQDYRAEGGTSRGEYFWQDLTVARRVHDARPVRHVDVGSRVDGFVAHVASFRTIEVLDIRPITGDVPGVTFKQADLMADDPRMAGYCDSLSCLHALEHFGLGRYGDPLDVHGPEKGLANLAKLVSEGGVFYLGTPVGRERVEFNANWVFDPRRIVALATENGLELTRLDVYRDGSPGDMPVSPEALEGLATIPYALGLFTFRKLAKAGPNAAV